MRRLAAALLRARKPRSLRGQLLVRSLLLVATLLLIVGCAQYWYMERFLLHNRANAIGNQIASVPGDIWLRFDRGSGRLANAPLFLFPASSIVLIRPDGSRTTLAGADDSGAAIRLDQAAYDEAHSRRRPDDAVYRIVDSAGAKQLVVVQPARSFNRTIGLVQLSTPVAPIVDDLRRQLLLYIVLSATALGAGSIVFLSALRRTLDPLSTMVETVERIDAGKLGERLAPHRGQLEIDRLARSFNGMLERLDASFRQEQQAKERMRRFVADASHELRTPLTSIHGFLEVLLRGAAGDPQRLEAALNSMYGESKRINKLVADLLLLARLDKEPALELRPADLAAVACDMEPQLRLLAGARRVELRGLPSPALADVDKLKQVLLNLFANAVQSTDPNDGVIAIDVRPDGDVVALTVRDNGVGIAPEHLSRLFDRFYRVEASRARSSGGAGLGLSISLSIVRLHGGDIRVTSVHGEGSAFRVELPLERSEGKAVSD